MANLISSTELAGFVSGIQDHFDTFSSLHTLVIVKPPLRQIVDINNNEYNGYGYQASVENYILVPRSGVYNCMTYTPDSWQDEGFQPIPNILLKGDMVIKIEPDANSYMGNGKTDFLIVDGENYTIEGGGMPTNYGREKYYYYSLKRTT